MASDATTVTVAGIDGYWSRSEDGSWWCNAAGKRFRSFDHFDQILPALAAAEANVERLWDALASADASVTAARDALDALDAQGALMDLDAAHGTLTEALTPRTLAARAAAPEAAG